MVRNKIHIISKAQKNIIQSLLPAVLLDADVVFDMGCSEVSENLLNVKCKLKMSYTGIYVQYNIYIYIYIYIAIKLLFRLTRLPIKSNANCWY